MLRRELPDGWDNGFPAFSVRRQSRRHPGRIGPGAERACQKRAVAARRFRRPRALMQNAADF